MGSAQFSASMAGAQLAEIEFRTQDLVVTCGWPTTQKLSIINSLVFFFHTCSVGVHTQVLQVAPDIFEPIIHVSTASIRLLYFQQTFYDHTIYN